MLNRESRPRNIEVFGVYLVGEALVGDGPELAHVDLLVGDKEGYVGQAFANGFSQLSVGHTPLLAVVRPNLIAKPATLLVPKVTVKSLEDAGRIFGPAQAAVSKAVVDSVEEGIIPKDKLESWVIICGVFVHPDAKDYRKIYHYNYGATKLALRRALTSYPNLDKVLYEKDRAIHPVMGFKVPRLWRPPYLQIVLDVPDIDRSKQVISQIPRSDRIILEIGSPLIKKYGAKAISEIRAQARDVFIIADFKTLDIGKVEVDLAFEETADAVTVSGLAPAATLDAFVYETRRLGMYSVVDMMGVEEPVEKLRSLKELPEVVLIDRGTDGEKGSSNLRLDQVKTIRGAFKDKKLLIAVAGGVAPDTASELIGAGADILVAGRFITQSRDVEHVVRQFLDSTREMKGDIDQLREHVE
jgi:bifunctional enzyme Fae/Hps